ncbi:MFS transporter [Silicimonas algicola]|uniref:EmrB/QacA subfamily drug resistance transporter n=1 Tax=Silicimonas algicola TaxID=1826607 RepID=A0A316GEU3_9RHOB|nr:MDR family MFS transporter [Silicimonas algicola]AZQ66159.1 MFS transporter [Silicimonas algicola]PWK58466.1 EmrB/QacA subfamily drug resistance transporter [Silicimonas algicola]
MTATADSVDPSPLSSASVRLGLGAVGITLLFASLGQTIVSPALPVIVAELGGLDHITWVITAYLLASTVGAPIAGKLGDLYGRKMVMWGAIGVFMLGAVLCGLAQSMGVLILGRLVQGLGGGSLIVLSMAVVGDLLPPRERGRAQGVLGAAFGVSTVIGPLLGGFLVESLSWHWIFFVNLPFGVLAFVLLGMALDSPPRVQRSIDYAGAALLAAVLSSAVLLSNMGGTVLPWASVEMAGLMSAFVLALVGFVAVERRAAEPILPMSLFRNNTFLVINAVGFLVGTAMFGTITFLPLFLQIVKGVTPTVSGLFLLPMMGGLIVTSTLAGQLMSRTGRYKRLPIGSTAILALAMLSLTQVSAETPLWSIALSLGGVGIGLGPVFAVGVAAVQNAVPFAMLGVGTASTNMFRLIGGSIGTAAFGAIFSAGIARHLEGELDGVGFSSLSAAYVRSLPPEAQALVTDGISSALHPVFWIAAAMSALAFGISMLLNEQPLSATRPA